MRKTFRLFPSQSYVYVGGLPSWYSERSHQLAMPLVLLEPRLRGSVRMLRYRAATEGTTKSGKKRSRTKSREPGAAEAVQEMMAYKVSRLLFPGTSFQ